MHTEKRKMLIRYVLPSILSSTCYFLFTIIDGIFIGKGVGTDGLGAINIIFPFVMIANAIFLLVSIGGVSVVAVRMGRGDVEGANRAFLHSLFFSAVFSLVLSLIGTVFSKQVTILLGGSDPAFLNLCTEYLFTYSLFIVPSGLSTALQNYCRNDGSPVLVSIATITGTVFNIFGDWYLIFPMKMGMRGAALATGISQSVIFLIVLSHFVFKRGKLRIKKFSFDKSLIGKIFLRGLPECIAQFSVPVATICMNYVLFDLQGPLGVNTYSLLAYVASFAVAVFAGTAQGLQPLFGQSYGSHRRDDLSYFLKCGIIINLTGSILINLILPFVSKDVCALFGADETTMNNAVKFMPYFSWGFIVESMNSILSAYLYSTKRSREAIITNVLRSFVFSTLVTLTLPYIWKSDFSVWMTFGIYQSFVLTAGIILTRRADKKLEFK